MAESTTIDGLIDHAEEMLAWSKEELREELKPYVEESPMWGKMLRHPLVYDIPLVLPGRANRAYEHKTKELAHRIKKGDWHSVVFIHERPYRTWALLEYVIGRDDHDTPLPLMSFSRKRKVLDLVADVWVDSENLEQHVAEWDALFDGADRLLLASRDERAEFAALPNVLTVYRGDIADGGYSWSLDPKIAHFFAHRFDANEPLVSGLVKKEHVIGYLSRRGESEVLVRREHVYDVMPYVYPLESDKR